MSAARKKLHDRLVNQVFWAPSRRADKLTARGAGWRLRFDWNVLGQIQGDLEAVLHRAKELVRETELARRRGDNHDA